MKKAIALALMPPLGACRYGCGTNCVAPISVFWLFGVISLVFGLLGGPTAELGVNWYTVALGIGMWAVAAVWTLLTAQGVMADRCHNGWSPRDHHIDPSLDEADPFEEIKRAH